ncbi:hypothetical protein WGT02_31885 (plasmid) [Rhizobium sp. T1470]|uniref:hypothetical protein n=1 Tax=Rhizobium sp. T1470 TaxID=555320 RepID=UPI001AAF80FC
MLFINTKGVSDESDDVTQLEVKSTHPSMLPMRNYARLQMAKFNRFSLQADPAAVADPSGLVERHPGVLARRMVAGRRRVGGFAMQVCICSGTDRTTICPRLQLKQLRVRNYLRGPLYFIAS